jgi:hypothetical protein
MMLVSGSAAAQIWQDVSETRIAGAVARPFAPERYRTLRLDETALRAVLTRAPMEFTAGRMSSVELALPMPDGALARFRIEESPIMEPGLAARYPEIHTYRGRGIDDPTATTRFGWTSAGFHAIILSANKGTVYIDPYRRGDTEHHISYFKRDNRANGRTFTCQVLTPEGHVESMTDLLSPEEMAELLDHRAGTLRTYRLAQAGNYEYVSFHSDPGMPNRAQAMSRGVVPTINRCNGIFERDLGIHLNLVANNDTLMFETPADPYTNNNGGAMLSQNQTVCDTYIGQANYDIGHVFSTGGGGVAFLGVVCDNTAPVQKAGGVTGSGFPIGDSFDVDYVIHEMGHQFRANHSFNGNAGSCSGGNRNGPTAYEVGSGSTIMAYAGICPGQNLQPHSDDNFHGISLQEMINFTDAGAADACAVKTTVPNQGPTVEAGSSYTIPARTPFMLTAVGSDPDNDPITYNWEEFDLGPPGSGTPDNGSSPIFRAFPSSTSPTRAFPRWSDILGNTTTYGEVLPITSRTMNFRCTIRDNYPGAGGVHWDATQVTTVSTAGPFLVSSPNGGEAWDALTPQSVTWAVASTDLAPINASTVDILLSTNGGATFDVVVATGVPNDGSETVMAPALESTQSRLMVKGGGNIFFDVSNNIFSIIGRPIAVADDDTTVLSVPVSVEVLSNDIDPNSDVLQIVTISSPTAEGGTAELQDSGTPGDPTDDTILYTPLTGFTGRDSFTYVISDGVYDDTTQVTIVVRRPEPSVGVDSPVAADLALRIRPNPMSREVQLEFGLSRPATVEAGVFSIQGRRVAQIVSGRFGAGPQSVRWDGRTRDGSRVASGVYLLRVVVDGHAVTRRMVVMQ